MDDGRPLLVLWADARPGIGVGHVVRSFALAQAWADQGGRARLLLTEPSALAWDLTADPTIERSIVDVDLSPYTATGGAALAAHAVASGASWVAIDSYATVGPAQAALRARGLRVLVIDDHRAAAPYDADLHLDQNLDARPLERSLGAQVALAGTRYALVRRAFRQAAPPEAPSSVDHRVLVTLGGGPTAESVAFATDVARRLAGTVSVDLVLGGEEPAGALPERVRVHERVLDPAALYRRADVAVSAAGSTAWELCALGVPAVLVPVAANQEPVARALAARGAALTLGPLASTSPTAVAAAACSLLADDDRRSRTGSSAREVVDGHGAVRVVAEMRAFGLSVRRAETSDCEQYFAWANDPSVRANSFSTDPIDHGDHVTWFHARLASASSTLFVVEDHGRAIGQVRFEVGEDGAAVVGISLDAACRGRALAAPSIIAATRAAIGVVPARTVRAFVRTTNEASMRAFRTAGFTERRSSVEHGVPAAMFELELEEG